jgi:hypothetical protein
VSDEDRHGLFLLVAQRSSARPRDDRHQRLAADVDRDLFERAARCSNTNEAWNLVGNESKFADPSGSQPVAPEPMGGQ